MVSCAKPVDPYQLLSEAKKKYYRSIIGIGFTECTGNEGYDRALAEKRARDDAIKQIKVTVSSEMKILEEEIRKWGEKSGVWGSSWVEFRGGEFIGKTELYGVKTVKFGKYKRNDKLICFAIVSVPRSLLLQKYNEEIRLRRVELEKLLDRAKAVKNEGKFKESVWYYLSALVLSWEINEYEYAKRAIQLQMEKDLEKLERKKTGVKEEKRYFPMKIQSEIISIFKEIEIEAVGETKIIAIRGRGIEEPLKVKVTPPYSGIPIKFAMDGNGEITKISFTTKEGIATAKVVRVDESNQQMITIKAYIDPNVLLPKRENLKTKNIIQDIRNILKEKYVVWYLILPRAGMEEVEANLSWALGKLIRGKAKVREISVSDIVDERTGMGSEFSRYIRGKIEEELSKMGFKISKYKPDSYEIAGNYWNFNDFIELRLKFKKGDEIISQNSVRIDKKDIPKKIQIEPEGKIDKEIINIKDVEGGLKIEVWTDRGKNPVYKEGEEMKFYVRVNKDSFVRILYFDADGKIIQIYPNQWSRTEIFRANKVYEIPGNFDNFRLIATPPYGVELLKVFAVEVKEEEILKLRDIKAEMKELEKTVREAVEETRGIMMEPKGRYSEKSVFITVIRK